MNLTPSSKLGAYEIVSKLGAGGMGEVYRARDTRLDREVAIKVLPADFANDADRLRRFEQEARATSALNHPNILTVYDIGEYEGSPYLVAELLEGNELREELNGGTLSARKAIDFAQQITAGLAAAHDKGIVHRDLKPENLFVTKDGRVKILDFGLAKLKPQAFGSGADSQAPTMKPLTSPGMVMGTVGYMSPEQVRGQEADHRSDIFSFGIILHEMLSGLRTFQRETLAETMTAILKDEPAELSETNAKVSPALDKIVRRCLEKKPENRFQTASDLGFALGTLATPSGSQAATPTGLSLASAGIPLGKSGVLGSVRLAWLVAGAALVAAVGLGVAYLQHRDPEPQPIRLFLPPPEKATLFDWPTMSPDGSSLAFIAEVDGKTQLWVRPLGATTERPLVEAKDNLATPFWSPDGKFIAYFDIPKLKKISLTGSQPETLCDSPLNGGGSWNRDGIILFGGGQNGIKRISANGGEVTTVTSLNASRGDTYHWAPAFLPDGKNFLYFVDNPDQEKRGIYLGSLDGRENRETRVLDARKVGIVAQPENSRKGYLLFEREGALLAQLFDFDKKDVTGAPVRLADHIEVSSNRFPKFSVATNGVLALLEKEADTQLTWLDRGGKKIGILGSPGRYSFPRLSPDGQRLAVSHTNPPAKYSDIYQFELANGNGMPFTFDPRTDERPVWSPDGSRLVWGSNRDGSMNLFLKAANGSGQDESLLRTNYAKRAFDWSMDGRFLLFGVGNPKTSGDLWILSTEGEHKTWPWLNTAAAENHPRFSPDGKWIAYQSNESGRDEVYIQAFIPGAPAAGGKRQLSTNGGTDPQWRRDGQELYYLSATGKLMVVPITTGVDLKAENPRELFAPANYRVSSDHGYTVTGDGQRFLFITSADNTTPTPFTVVLNWMTEIKK